MPRVKSPKFSLYVEVICSLLRPRRDETAGKMDMNISSFVAPCALENFSSHWLKYRGDTSSQGRTTSAALTATSLIRRSSTLVFVKRIRLFCGDFRVAILKFCTRIPASFKTAPRRPYEHFRSQGRCVFSRTALETR